MPFMRYPVYAFVYAFMTPFTADPVYRPFTPPTPFTDPVYRAFTAFPLLP